MANLAQGPFTNGISWSRTPSFGNSVAKTLIIGPKEVSTGGGGGPSIPTEGLIWWPRK